MDNGNFQRSKSGRGSGDPAQQGVAVRYLYTSYIREHIRKYGNEASLKDNDQSVWMKTLASYRLEVQ
jgi:hypothetical protein